MVLVSTSSCEILPNEFLLDQISRRDDGLRLRIRFLPKSCRDFEYLPMSHFLGHVHHELAVIVV